MTTTENQPTAAQPIDLLPCPFCGGAATPREGSNWYGVGCDTISAGIMCFGYCHARQYTSASNAAAAWNTRALARQQPAASEQASAAPSSKDAGGEPVAMISAVELRDIQSGRMGVPVRGAGWREDQDIALYLAAPAPHAQAEPAARVDRIISASGLAEVSVFLESALKVGTVFYAASGAGEVAASVKTWQERSEAAMQTANWYPAGHYKDLEIADLRAQLAAAPAAPHAQAEPRYQEQFDGEYGSSVWHDVTEAAYHTFLPAHRRTLCAAPVPQEAEQAAPLDDNEVARLRRVVRAMGMEKEVPDDDESLRGCLFSVLGMMARKLEAEQAATAAVTAPAGVTLKAIRAHGSKEWFIYIEHPFGTSYVRMSDRRDLQLAELIACQPAAPAVTDAARDVLADAKGGA